MHNFEVVSKVGQGAYASVYKAKRKQDGAFYALKKIKFANRSPREVACCLNEVRILASLTNPYILAYREAFYDETEQSLVLVTEFATEGDLSNYIKDRQKKKERIAE
jgi:NIMA (never in mitosis gene a)-related kinase 1/4/5